MSSAGSSNTEEGAVGGSIMVEAWWFCGCRWSGDQIVVTRQTACTIDELFPVEFKWELCLSDTASDSEPTTTTQADDRPVAPDLLCVLNVVKP